MKRFVGRHHFHQLVFIVTWWCICSKSQVSTSMSSVACRRSGTVTGRPAQPMHWARTPSIATKALEYVSSLRPQATGASFHDLDVQARMPVESSQQTCLPALRALHRCFSPEMLNREPTLAELKRITQKEEDRGLPGVARRRSYVGPTCSRGRCDTSDRNLSVACRQLNGTQMMSLDLRGKAVPSFVAGARALKVRRRPAASTDWRV